MLLLAIASAVAAAATNSAPPPATCEAAALRGCCLPCQGSGGTGSCAVLQRVQYDLESGTVGALAAKCCAAAALVPKCSVWTLNHRNGDCIIKTQGIDSPRWNETGDPCTSGRGPAPLPPPGPPPRPPGPPGPAPAPPCPPRPPAPRPHAPARNLLYLVVDDLRNELGYTNNRKGLVTPNIDARESNPMSIVLVCCRYACCSLLCVCLSACA